MQRKHKGILSVTVRPLLNNNHIKCIAHDQAHTQACVSLTKERCNDGAKKAKTKDLNTMTHFKQHSSHLMAHIIAMHIVHMGCFLICKWCPNKAIDGQGNHQPRDISGIVTLLSLTKCRMQHKTKLQIQSEASGRLVSEKAVFKFFGPVQTTHSFS